MQSITVISSFCHHYSRFSPVFNPRAFRNALTKSKKAVSGKDPLTAADNCVSAFLYYFLIKILILIRKASPDDAACFVIYKERNHKTGLI